MKTFEVWIPVSDMIHILQDRVFNLQAEEEVYNDRLSSCPKRWRWTRFFWRFYPWPWKKREAAKLQALIDEHKSGPDSK